MKIVNYDLTAYENDFRKDELVDLRRMFKVDNFDEKYILFVQADFWYNLDLEKITGHVIFDIGNKETEVFSRLRKKYPNKLIHTVSKVVGRKCCRYGIPLLFDTFEELNKLQQIKIYWKYINELGEEVNLYIRYIPTFEFKRGKRVYSLRSYDYEPKNPLLCRDQVESYFDEFEKMVMIKYKNGNKDIDSIKGTIDELSLSNIENEIYTIESHINKHTDYKIYYFESNIELTASRFAKNLPHLMR